MKAFSEEQQTIERQRIKVRPLKWMKLNEIGYIPVGAIVTEGTISQKADQNYLSITGQVLESFSFTTEMSGNRGRLGALKFCH